MKSKSRNGIAIIGLATVLCLLVGTLPAGAEEGDPEVLALMHAINEGLAEAGLNIAVEQIEFFTIGLGRPSNRIHQQPFRWVPGDPRRLA